jgi:hypothetical protein
VDVNAGVGSGLGAAWDASWHPNVTKIVIPKKSIIVMCDLFFMISVFFTFR